MRVSIIIPTFNRSSIIGKAVECALAQTYRNAEVIVVDDGSTDDTRDALEPYIGRIRYLRQSNSGPSAARNHGAREADCDIIAFLDSDDHWLPEKIARQVSLLARVGAGIACCVCNAAVVGMDGTPAGETFDSASLDVGFAEGLWINPQEILSTRFLLFNQVVAVRREAFERVGGFDESLRLLEDYELSMRLASLGSWAVIADPLVVKRNDTMGIGVQCMDDLEKHLDASILVAGKLLESGKWLNPRSRALLKIGLNYMLQHRLAHRLRQRGGFVAAGSGRALELLSRSRAAVRRRMPGWPRFKGHAF